ncbi:hypothetical protein SCG7086_AZ_00080 [Chlamydiales bacterium SCGC AG-110-P3]|nr:hypothetical protein SCG7086_AZ_00080 [Chlamydiales bacterium SCGC AG-110-P3]
MTSSVLSRLQEVAQGMSACHTPEEKISTLLEAFELFSKETSRLESAYRSLQQQFSSVNTELEETNRTLNAKVLELDVTTNYLQSILENMSQGILFVGVTGAITTYNKAAEGMLRHATENVLWRSYRDTFSDTFFGFSMKDALATSTVPATTYVTTDDGRELAVSSTASSHHDASAQGLILLIRDITELRHLQTIASRSDRMKELGEMAASVAHEIRNPLGGIKGFASLLVRDLADRTELCQMAEYIVEGTITLDRLVTDVLNYSRPVQMQLETTDLSEVLRNVCTFIEADHSLGSNIALHLSCDDIVEVALDQQMFRSAILNLLVNGAQAMPDGGTLTIALRKGTRRATVTVHDTGTGIAPENLENIFSPFFTTKPEGNGFGLPEVYKVVQAHGGAIDATSTVEAGTTFTITLPLKP